jgi:glycerol-3-phosphate acyltransferase PlsX
VVCDGFVGNVILKFGEGIGEFFFNFIKKEISGGGIILKLGAFLLMPIFKKLKKLFSYDEVGGGVLIGIKKPVIITHGRANAKAIKNSIRVAAQLIKDHVNEEIEDNIKKIGGEK